MFFNKFLKEARPLQQSSKSRSVFAVVLLATGFFLVAMRAQAPQGPLGGAKSMPPASLRTFPAPINLKVLRKDLTGRQVHDVMEQWGGSLGVRCDACHVEDTEGTAHDGKPHLDFADDSKPMKAVARLMYTMTAEINSNYITKVKGSSPPVTCGTCHRGVVSPAPFAVQSADEPAPAQPVPSAEERKQPK